MRRSIPYLLLLLAALLVYSPALQNGFVWDDTALVLRDPLIRSPQLLADGFHHFLFLDATASDFYRPLQRVAYTVDYTAAGFQPWVFHLTNILVHAGAAMALYALGRRVLDREKISASFVAFSVALLWAVHPVHSSAVAYVAGLADPLAALLGFSGLALLLGGSSVAAGLCLGLALFAKESGVFALIIGVGFAWRMAGKQKAAWQERLSQFFLMAAPALLVSLLYLALRGTAEHIPAPHPDSIPFGYKLVNGLRAVAEYAGLIIAPVHLQMERDVRAASGAFGNLQIAVGALLLFAACLWFWRSDRKTRACLVAALVAYLPTSNLFTLNATVAEHWIYVPSAFLFLAVASTYQNWIASHTKFPKIFLVIFGIWIAALACRTAWRCTDWKDQETFLKSTIASNGDSSRMLGNLASQHIKNGDVEGAIRSYQIALEKSPTQPFAMLGLSSALIRKGDFAQARQLLERCEKIPLIRADALVQRAVLEFKESGQDRADLLREAAEEPPRFWPIRKRYIAHLVERGDIEQALRELRDLLRGQPYRAETWEMLGNIATKIGNTGLAQSAYLEADKRDVHRGKTGPSY